MGQSIFKFFTILLMPLILLACGAKLDDLEDFVSEVKARPRGKIKALPVYPPYETHVYNSLEMRAPFEPPEPEENLVIENLNISKRVPNTERPRFPLEQYDITQFKMVGAIGDKNNQQALVSAGGQVYRVAVGDYVGKSDGLVTSVGDQGFSFVELVLAGVDIWTERPRVIKLNSGDGK